MFGKSSRKSGKLRNVAQDDDVPKKSEIQQHLGASLTQVLFDYSHQEVVKLLGPIPSEKLFQPSYCTAQDCQPKADKPDDDWLEEQKISKAHVHHDVLALGEGLLKKFQTEIEEKTRVKMKDEFDIQFHKFEAEKRYEMRSNMYEIHTMYEQYFSATQHELEVKLQAEWNNVKQMHNKELQKSIVKTRLDTTHDVLRRLRPHVCYIITSIHDNFQQSLCAQREKMIADFNKIMRTHHNNWVTRTREFEQSNMEELLNQRHELEIQNATDIIYVLCMERIRNDTQVHTIHKLFEEKLKVLNEAITKQDEIINTMRKKITKYQDRNATLKKKLSTTTNEFQKFINFALDSMPKHADFLLPLKLSFEDETNDENCEEETK